MICSIQIHAYDPARDRWSTASNITLPREPFSHALSVPDHGIYLTSKSRPLSWWMLARLISPHPFISVQGVFSNVLYHIRPESSLQPEAVGEFQTIPLNSCYIETIDCVLTFTTVAELGSSDEKIHQIERFDLKKRSFSVVWKETCSSSSILDFGQTLGCFPFVFYEWVQAQPVFNK